MECKVYTISADPRKCDKVDNNTPYNVYHTAVKPTERVDVITPTFVFDYAESLLTCNYLWCKEFSRYYFVDNIAIDTAGRVVLSCSIDVLQTYASDIKNCEAVVIRAASKGKPTMYTDTKLPIYPNKKVVSSIVKSETGGNFSANGGYCYVLNVIGGAPISNE